jgi:hypothetical protein
MSRCRVLCLNKLLEGYGTDKLCQSVIEGKVCKLGSSLGRVQEVPEEVLATVTATALTIP